MPLKNADNILWAKSFIQEEITKDRKGHILNDNFWNNLAKKGKENNEFLYEEAIRIFDQLFYFDIQEIIT